MRLDLADLPFPIYTKRLLLRPHVPEDALELKAAIDESFDDLHQWMDWAATRPSLAECEVYIRNARTVRLAAGDLGILVFRRDGGELVGSSGFHEFSEATGSVSTGYWVRRRFAAQGYITESTAALTHYAFCVLGAQRVEIRCDPENARSAAVAKRLGFTLERHLKNNTTKPHSIDPRDSLIFARRDAAGLPDVGATWPKDEKVGGGDRS